MIGTVRGMCGAVLLSAMLLASGCSRTWEDRPYRHSDAGSFAKESEAYRRSYAEEYGSPPEEPMPGSGREAEAGMLLTFRVEALDDGGEVFQVETVRLLHPGLSPVQTTDRRPWETGPETEGQVIGEFGSLQLPMEYLLGVRVGGTRLFRKAGPISLRSMNEKETRHIQQYSRQRDGVVYSYNPDLRVTLVDACKADLRIRHWRHMVWSRGGTFAMPKGFTTVNWYELRGCE